MKSMRQVVWLWLVWSVVMVGYMEWASMRFRPERPDFALPWTPAGTAIHSNDNKPYLLDPFLNSIVGWDSEYYLSIATVGYEDPQHVASVQADGVSHSKNYAFFPLYPYLMKAVRAPFAMLGLSPIGASTLAGLLVSLLGTLGALLALVDLAREELGEDGALRTAFLMLVFPSSFFFATVYTEGLFAGLAFGSLALLRRGRWTAAALLAAFATWTRSIGILLLLPLLWAWGTEYARAKDRRALWARAPILLAPLLAYGLWRLAFGAHFDFVQEHWFGNRLFDFQTTAVEWERLLQFARRFPDARFQLTLNLVAAALAFLSCLLGFRRYPAISLFGAFALLVPMAGGGAGTHSALRYVLVVPTLWIVLGRWTRRVVVERGWTLLSILLLALQAYLFSVDMWSA